jgi:hypothetical protein
MLAWKPKKPSDVGFIYIFKINYLGTHFIRAAGTVL